MSYKRQFTYSYDQIDSVADTLIGLLKKARVVTFTGSLGAGKTTLIAAVLKKMGINDVVTSPTFTYMQVYKTREGKNVYHFDLYRLASLDDFLEAGFDEYLYQPNSLVLIEWPGIILPLLNHDVSHISIDYGEQEDQRMLTIEHSNGEA